MLKYFRWDHCFLKVIKQPAFTCLKITVETPEQGLKYVKTVKMTATASSWCIYCWLWTYFAPCFSFSIVNFEHVIARSVGITRSFQKANCSPANRYRKFTRFHVRWECLASHCFTNFRSLLINSSVTSLTL